MAWTIKNITDTMKDPDWIEAGIQIYSLKAESMSLVLLALDPEKCGLFQITAPLDKSDVMDAFLHCRDELKLDNVPIFTTNQSTEDDTRRLVKLASTHIEEIPDSILKEFMLRDDGADI